jgi:hypothetical protein
MKTLLQKLAIGMGVVFVCTALAANMNAQCGGIDARAQVKPQSWAGSGSTGSLLYVSERKDHGNDDEEIVGFWRITLISEGNSGNPAPFNPPDDVPIDHGFAQWHSDGTEIMNSNRVPSTGSFCLGVWKKVGTRHYKLNHFALAFDDGVHQGYDNIREDIVLSRDGDSFSGSFVVAKYDINGNSIVGIKGKIVGTRVKLNTTVQDIL